MLKRGYYLSSTSVKIFNAHVPAYVNRYLHSASRLTIFIVTLVELKLGLNKRRLKRIWKCLPCYNLTSSTAVSLILISNVLSLSI